MDYSTENIRAKGSSRPKILVITEIPSQRTIDSGRCLGQKEMEVFSEAAEKAGLENQGTVFINPCPPIPPEYIGSERKVGEWLGAYAEEFQSILRECSDAKLVICLGKDAIRQMMGRPQKITRIAGQLLDPPSYFSGKVLPVYSPRMVLRKPDIAEVFEAQMRMAGVYQRSGWEDTVFQGEDREARYRWATDLQFLIDSPPERLVVDTETIGVKWFEESFKVLTVQLCWGVGKAVSVPLDRKYYPALDLRTRSRLIGQMKAIFSNPATQIIGHNLKFDIHALWNLGIEVPSWWADTIQLAFLVDENMEMKGLDDCVRRWVPEMSGYADEFNRDPIHQGKSRMDLVPHDKMLAYGCGDVDATFRLAEFLISEGKKDTRNWRTFHTVQMPALQAFAKMERQGLRINLEQLNILGKLVEIKERELYAKLIQSVDSSLKLDHLNDPSNKGKSAREILNFASPKFLLDVLFKHPRGLCLEPVVFTKTTARLPDDEKIPSTSANDHLPFFTDREFVRDLIEYKKLEKMRTSYVGTGRELSDAPVTPLKKGNWPKKIFDAFKAIGITLEDSTTPSRRRKIVLPGREPSNPENLIALGQDSSGVSSYAYLSGGKPYIRRISKPTGFWQHLPPGRNDIHPSFWVHRTVTGRTASSDPNAQNFPKRGELAEAFRKLFIPAKGWVFLECDLSQIELRIAAWMAMEPTMLAIYRSGGDIHAATAASTLGISMEQFASFSGNKNPYQASFFGHMPSDIKTLDDFYEFKRFQAKAINFGFIYGMWWPKFKVYAKTDYGIEFTDDEAREVRETFFETFPGLDHWHRDSKKFVMDNGFVRALHGALRRLPSVYSDDEGIQKEAQRQAVNCLSDDTEILTEGGWKTVDDLSEGDTVFSVNPSTGGVERDAVLAIHCGNINGRMLNYEGSVSALATPNHRWLVDRYSQAKVTKGNLESVFVESKGLSDYGDHRIWLAGGALQQDETQWTNDECALMGWVLTDGYYKRQNCPKTGKAWGTGRIGVTQTKKKNIGELDALFTRLGKHSRRVRKTGQHVWEITTCATKRMRDAMPGKTLTTDVILSMNSEQRKLLYETMLRGDGCYDTKAGRYRKFCAGSKERADAFLALCALIGQPASAVCRDFSSYSPKQYASMGNVPKSGNCWLVELKQRNRAQSGYGKSWVEWEGRVWCPTTRNGTWIAKRNGKVFVTGNSPVQRFGSDLGLMGVTRFSRDCDHRVMHPCGFIHDAGIIHVREDHVDEAAFAIKFYMESNPLRQWFNITPPLPLLADVSGPGDSLGGLKKMKNVQAHNPDWYNAELDLRPCF